MKIFFYIRPFFPYIFWFFLDIFQYICRCFALTWNTSNTSKRWIQKSLNWVSTSVSTISLHFIQRRRSKNYSLRVYDTEVFVSQKWIEAICFFITKAKDMTSQLPMRYRESWVGMGFDAKVWATSVANHEKGDSTFTVCAKCWTKRIDWLCSELCRYIYLNAGMGSVPSRC